MYLKLCKRLNSVNLTTFSEKKLLNFVILSIPAERGSPSILGKRDSLHLPPPNRATKPSVSASSSQQPNNENNLNRHNVHSNGINEMHTQRQSHPAHQPAHQLPPAYSIASSCTSSTATASSVAAATAAGAKQLLRVRRFLSTLHQFACELSSETGNSAQNLIFGLVVSFLSKF